MQWLLEDIEKRAKAETEDEANKRPVLRFKGKLL